jgi:DNA polymerase III epsilon subunit-like protein
MLQMHQVNTYTPILLLNIIKVVVLLNFVCAFFLEFSVVQKEVAALLKGRILVGHALENDLKVCLSRNKKKKQYCYL